MLPNIDVPVEIIQYFATSHTPVCWQIDDKTPLFVKKTLEKLSFTISIETIQDLMSSTTFQQLHNDSSYDEREKIAREEILFRLISNRINRARIELLRNNHGKDRSQPYNHKSLLNVEVDKHNLVNLNQFQVDNSHIERNGYVFEVALTLPDNNSSYWLKEALLNLSINASKSIRLAPLAIQSKTEYRSNLNHMLAYGVLRDWEQISSLKEDTYGRWMPDDPSIASSIFTDILWSPRGNEVHFLCEEIPKKKEVQDRGSRYFHSIYLPAKKHFIHIDGAVRYYNKDEIDSRLKCHVRNAGKIGQRIKIFKVDGNISPENWGRLLTSFFVWNEDVTNYVANGSGIPKYIENA